jgi:hypothetical protein
MRYLLISMCHTLTNSGILKVWPRRLMQSPGPSEGSFDSLVKPPCKTPAPANTPRLVRFDFPKQVQTCFFRDFFLTQKKRCVSRFSRSFPKRMDISTMPGLRQLPSGSPKPSSPGGLTGEVQFYLG